MWRRSGVGPELREGGVKTPVSRKGLMLDMVRRDEAEGERRMMGSFWRGLEEGTEGLRGMEGRGWPGRVGRLW